MRGNKRPILVVEGDAESREALCRLLQREFAVYGAADAWEALETVRQRDIQVVIAGQRLPEMTGMELLHRVARLSPATVRIALAAYADLRAVIEASADVPLFRYLTKPCDGEELLMVVRQAGGQYDQAREQQELLRRLQVHQMECLQFLDALRRGGFGAISLPGHAQAMELVALGDVLLDHLHGATASGADAWIDGVGEVPVPLATTPTIAARRLGDEGDDRRGSGARVRSAALPRSRGCALLEGHDAVLTELPATRRKRVG